MAPQAMSQLQGKEGAGLWEESPKYKRTMALLLEGWVDEPDKHRF